MKAKQLSELEIEEISLVDLPATKATWTIVKSKDGKQFDKNQDGFHNKNKIEVKKMDELIKILKSITGVELSEKQTELLKTLSDEEKKALGDSLGVVEGYKEELPKELNETFSYLTKFAVREQPEPKVPEITQEEKDKIIAEFDKAGKKLSKDTLDIIEGAVKKLGDLTEIVDALSNLLPEEDGKKVKKTDKEKEGDELKKREKEFGEKVDKVLKDAKTVLDEKLAEKDEKIEELAKRLKTVEETKGTKKSLEEEKEEVKKEAVKWPSFVADEE